MDGRAQSPAAPRLLDQMRDVIRTRHYSIRTEESYLQWVRRFILFHGKRHPAGHDLAGVYGYLQDYWVAGK